MEIKTKYITKNLTTREAACPCCNDIFYTDVFYNFVNMLQVLRDTVNKPFIYSKGGFCRCRIYNDSLSNSSKRSQHLMGNAADITTHEFSAIEKWKFVKQAINLGFSIGAYSAHFHIDRRPGIPVFFYGKY